MNSKSPIIIVPGDPNSIFFEIFFKSLKKKKYKSPIILIASQKLINLQIKKVPIEIDKKKELDKIVMIETTKQLDRFSNIFYDKIKLNSKISEF